MRIAPSACAQASVDPNDKPPNAIAMPAIICRRVGPFVSFFANEF